MKYDFKIDMAANNAHTAIIRKIKKGTKILEFGPATGYMSRYLKENLKCKVYGIEIDREAARVAGQFCEEVIVCDVDSLEWKKKLVHYKFDYIIFADVLEHLKDPWCVLKEAVNLLSSNGELLISMPNVSHNAVLIELLLGEFKYRNLGLLDNTHLRFFTKSSLIDLVDQAGLKITDMQQIVMPPEVTELKSSYTNIPDNVSNFLKRRPDGHVYQYIVSARKKGINEEEIISSNIIADNLNISSDYVELFWDSGEGFREKDSSKLPISQFGEKQEYIFELPNITVQSIRLDPGNSPGFVCIEEICIVDSFGNEVRSLMDNLIPFYGMKLYGANKNEKYFLCHNNDPQLVCYLNEETYLKNMKIKISMNFSKTYIDYHVKLIDDCLSELEKDVRNLIGELQEQKQDIHIKENEIVALIDRNKSCEAEIERLLEHNGNHEIEIGRLLTDNKNLQREISILCNTFSWRVTKPLRVLKKILSMK